MTHASVFNGAKLLVRVQGLPCSEGMDVPVASRLSARQAGNDCRRRGTSGNPTSFARQSGDRVRDTRHDLISRQPGSNAITFRDVLNTVQRTKHSACQDH